MILRLNNESISWSIRYFPSRHSNTMFLKRCAVLGRWGGLELVGGTGIRPKTESAGMLAMWTTCAPKILGRDAPLSVRTVTWLGGDGLGSRWSADKDETSPRTLLRDSCTCKAVIFSSVIALKDVRRPRPCESILSDEATLTPDNTDALPSVLRCLHLKYAN